ncbi:hypothetical protein A2127_00395 [Candidatus Jorgensenbacteria bacterium GWC1_48_12]|uniref:Uncharacterized protein n=2 Tax=Parcubacteria group TaxID=1794811 RepID=A0A1F6BRQ6_9BACT|nr:MAG: hypothetical protein A2567_01145 [Candidatus Azambacteria bacterium RIFOXYD1_FULL_42_11]OGG39611.1 MAG: hypothetical protein A2127_00395 [Candidatus Jorgensenbacteria bacterium GWC1_48_12]
MCKNLSRYFNFGIVRSSFVLLKIKTGKRNRVKRMPAVGKGRRNYDRRVYEEIVKPVKKAAEKAFRKYGLGRPKIIVIKSKARK